MGWADEHITNLRAGETVQFRPLGHSMTGRVNHEQMVVVEPITEAALTVDEIVLCTVNGRQFLHLIKECGTDGRYLIGNNKGGINGWIERPAVHGRLIAVEDI